MGLASFGAKLQNTMRRHAFLASILTATTLQARAADWACWRGADGAGLSPEKNLPTEWGNEKNVAWKKAIPGKGASSPIIVGDRVYASSQLEDTSLHLFALDRKTGETVWDAEIGKGKLRSNNLHNMATPTPVSDGKSVWVMFGTGDLACVDGKGKIVWQRNLVKEYGEFKTNHGYGSSPMLEEGKLFITCMHQGPSYLLALDPQTGKNVWKKERDIGPKGEAQDSYSSPVFQRVNGKTELVLEGAESVNAYNPATGEEIWVAKGLTVPHPYGRTISGPTAGEGVVVAVASGFQNRGYTVALKAGGKGDITETHKLWTSAKFSPDCPTPVIYGGKLFSIRDDGMASCLDLKTGEALWQERLYSANVKVSPVAADGKVYFMNGNGNCVVTKASGKLEILATNELRENTLSSPAISHGQLFLRTDNFLYCVGK